MKAVKVLAAVGFALATVAVGTPLWAQAAAPKKPPVIAHDTAGRGQCLTCHGGAMEGIKAAPKDHAGRTNAQCLMCHAKTSPMQTGTPPAMAHTVAGKEACLTCHGGAMEGIKAAPANHKGFDVKNCTLCHAQPKG
ncbi:MAG: cytochrome c3 family protein [Micromonosporaceae bacterium]